MTRYRHARQDHEPVTIDATVIASHLDDHGCPRMAAFVRHLGESCRAANAREQHLRDAVASVLEQLHKYEPPAQRVIPDYRPPAEASD